MRGYFSPEFSLVVTLYWRAPKRVKQLSMVTIPLCFEFFRCCTCWCLAELIFTYLDQPCSILLAEFNMAAFTALFKNTRTLKFKGQLTFAYFAAVNHLSGPLRKQWSVIGGFRLACVQTPLPSGKVLEGTPSPIFPEGRGVCTQARFPSVFCVSVFHRSFFNFRVHVF